MGAKRDFSICCPLPFAMPTHPFDHSHESNRPGHLQRPAGPRSASTTTARPAGPLRPSGKAGSAAAAKTAPPSRTAPRREPQRGDWLWACRPGAEDDVADELVTRGLAPSLLQPGLVLSTAENAKGKRVAASDLCSLTFARQGLPVQWVDDLSEQAQDLDATALAKRIANGLYRDIKDRPLAVHVFSADSERGKTLSARCADLHAALGKELAGSGYSVAANGATAHSEGGQLLQVCLLSPDQIVAGVLLTSVALSLFPGGIQRVRRSQDAPSRSASKLSEALAWLGHGPQGGEDCVDLGAAPGGWSQVLAERGCSVLAVDMGRLAPGLSRRIKHVRQNAFDYEPEAPVDWLCCDMAYRPLEVAGLLARWGRRRWARFVIANIKLPMKQRVAMLARVREILESGGWTGLRARQLYHDRDEVTLFAWRGFGLDTRVQHRSPLPRNDSQDGPAVPFRAPQRPTRGGRGDDRPQGGKRASAGKPGRRSATEGGGARGKDRTSHGASGGRASTGRGPRPTGAKPGKPGKSSQPGKGPAKRSSPGRSSPGRSTPGRSSPGGSRRPRPGR